MDQSQIHGLLQVTADLIKEFQFNVHSHNWNSQVLCLCDEHVCTHMYFQVPGESGKSMLDSLELDLKGLVNCPTWVLGLNLSSLG